MADYTPLTNLRGPAARIVEATGETVPSGTGFDVVMTGPDQGRKFHFKVERGLPGVNGVENDTAVATYIGADDTLTGAAVAARADAVVAPVRSRAQAAISKGRQPGLVEKGAGLSWSSRALVFHDGVTYFSAFDPATMANAGGATYYVSDRGDGSSPGTRVAGMASAIESGSVITSLPVSAATAAVPSGARVAVIIGEDVTFFTTTAAVTVGATSIAVTSTTVLSRVPAGSAVVAPRQGLASTLAAMASGDTVVLLDPFNYRNRGTQDTLITKSCNIVGLKPGTILTTSDDLAWTLTAGKSRTYEAARTNVRTVVDVSVTADGYEYERVATMAEVDDARGRWYQAADGSGLLYVSPIQSGAPNNQKVLALLASSHFQFQAASTDLRIYLKNLRIFGGHQGVRVIAPGPGKVTFTRDTSPMLWGGQSAIGATAATLFNGLSIIGNVDSYAYRSPVLNSCLDGHNYHASGAYIPRGVEIDSGGHSAGTGRIPTALGVAPTQNISTAHDGVIVLRVGGDYHHAYGTPIADVNPGTISENYGVNAYDSVAPDGDYNAAFSAQQSGAEMRLFGCRAWGTSNDLFAADGATVIADETQFDTTGGAGALNITNPR